MIDGSIYIEDLVKDHPEVISPLAELGVVCIECGEPVWGTLEELVKSKELNIKIIVKKINQIIEDKN